VAPGVFVEQDEFVATQGPPPLAPGGPLAAEDVSHTDRAPTGVTTTGQNQPLNAHAWSWGRSGALLEPPGISIIQARRAFLLMGDMRHHDRGDQHRHTEHVVAHPTIVGWASHVSGVPLTKI
jgi:hypothetical protein